MHGCGDGFHRRFKDILGGLMSLRDGFFHEIGFYVCEFKW